MGTGFSVWFHTSRCRRRDCGERSTRQPVPQDMVLPKSRQARTRVVVRPKRGPSHTRSGSRSRHRGGARPLFPGVLQALASERGAAAALARDAEIASQVVQGPRSAPGGFMYLLLGDRHADADVHALPPGTMAGGRLGATASASRPLRVCRSFRRATDRRRCPLARGVHLGQRATTSPPPLSRRRAPCSPAGSSAG
ncbi:MAG: hypothetical protein AW08_01268 [Candidatus Accumulibacter adjunctus]|uniref:Uncharacterized protein n=1 Tax=Candidatus Accumulibacter adjunctus TaxID=1454001 RepID=A0A011N0Y2_9PROT|nr:MAG: hypothetical protein AW08_01268 [Candidatus Accumulibacter adjunctus]